MKKLLPNKITNTKKFYDNVSGFYEKMIDFEKNLELRINAYRNIFPSCGLIADIGCGVGLDSIALAKNGHNVTAFDISPQMVEEAKKNLKKYNVNFQVYKNSFLNIPNKYHNQFDSVVCVGNTIAHLSPTQLKRAINKIFMMLKPSGTMLLHILNYPLIVKNGKRINNIANRGGQTIVRFYDFKKNKIIFNILAFSSNQSKEYHLVSTPQYPHTAKIIKQFLKQSGFIKMFFYEDFFKNKLISLKSKDIFIQAVK
jgi:glycine/sarcosine N-methyltransferase